MTAADALAGRHQRAARPQHHRNRLGHDVGSGHSRVNTEELFPRIRSYPGLIPFAERALSDHVGLVGLVGPNGPHGAMYLEKVPGLVRDSLDRFESHTSDSFLIFSSVGAIHVPASWAAIWA